ncbi:hypothetical protein G6F66_015482 [Rhizopus arrhizus]|nr:hypothetical protein G6F66_015482 [Rhizopus arrhizus]
MDVTEKRDENAAHRIIANDEAIDALEQQISHDVMRLALRGPLAELSRSYGSPFVLHGLDLLHGGLVLLGTLLLGWLGAWRVTGHFLRQTRPTDT